ncbi:unnamed protein product [marine sediment metagenome]|uniref:VanZ-like domain-containing protein n=1 Tax=marine sediment metagenome TaxID=412755 RepID=X1I032_9ZZZZ
MKQIFFYLLLFFYTVGIFVASSLSGEQMEDVPVFFFTDKVAHILVYLGWGFLFALAVGRRGLSGRHVLTGMALACLVGLFDELWQGYLQKGRMVELGDWLGDIFGTTLGLLAFYYLRKIVKGEEANDAQPQLR